MVAGILARLGFCRPLALARSPSVVVAFTISSSGCGRVGLVRLRSSVPESGTVYTWRAPVGCCSPSWFGVGLRCTHQVFFARRFVGVSLC